MEDTESDGYVIADDIDLAGGSWGFVGEEKDPSEYLPSEEKAEWFDNLIDENNTVLQ